MLNIISRSTATLLAILLLLPRNAHADDVASFYRTHDLTLLIGTSSGGGYDLAARFLARYLPEHIPGHPRIVIENMAGAGGIVAGSYLSTSAPRDGSLIASVLNNVPFEPLFGTKAATYDPIKFNWIGSTNPETAFLITWHTSPVRSLEDAQKHEISVGTSGTASAPTFFARLLNETLRTKLKIIPGYPGTSEAFLAMERGELDGYGSAFSSDLTSFKPEWIRDHMVNIVFQYGPEPDADFASVPFAPDSVKDPSDKNLMQAALALLAMGRPFTMPAGVPADRVEAIRNAFAETIRDPDVVAAAKKIGIKLDRGQTGIQLQSVVAKTYETPPALIEKLRLLKTAP